jgi:hypothetical protein
MELLLPKSLQNRGPQRLLRLAFVVLVCPVVTHVTAIKAVAQGTAARTAVPREVQTASRAKAEALPSPQWSNSTSEGAPTTQPHVRFEEGLLTISANNSSLSDVLMAVRAATGADIDLPGGVSGERVTASLGPGPARKVLSDLLGWSSFDYIIQGSDANPQTIQSVTLLVRTKSAGPTTALNSSGPSRQAPNMPMRTAAEPPAPAPVDAPEADTAPAAQATNGADMISAPQVEVQPKPISPGASMDSATGKSTSEMIQELQQMYEQRRQIQQQQNANPGANPVPK